MIQPITAISRSTIYRKQPSFRGTPPVSVTLTEEEAKRLAAELAKRHNIISSTLYDIHDAARILAPTTVNNLDGMGKALKEIFTPDKNPFDIAKQAQKFTDKNFLENANFKLLDANNIVDINSGTIEHMTYSGDIVRLSGKPLAETFNFHSLVDQRPTLESFLEKAGVSEVESFDFSSLPDQIPAMDDLLDIIGKTIGEVVESGTDLQ